MGLVHAAQFWIDHFQSAMVENTISLTLIKHETIENFLSHHFLEWLERLSLVGQLVSAVRGLKSLLGIMIRIGNVSLNLLSF